MNSSTAARIPSLNEAARFAPEQVVQVCADLARDLAATEHQLEISKQQLEWFKRQLFGHKSERRILENASAQLNLAELADPGQAQAPQKQRLIAAHTRSAATNKPESAEESLPFFDATRVPVELIELPAPQAQGLAPEDYEIISHKDSYRLAQRPGSYVVLHYRRPVIKLRASAAIACAPAPAHVLEGSRAEVSFVAGVLIDKFAYHLPLYRQHQRLADCGIHVSRPWLTQIAHQGASLLEPIYAAQFASIRQSRVKAMDETPIKAGRGEPGKMKAAYFWPVYGEGDEVCFAFFESRRAEHVPQALGLTPGEGAVLLSDGYAAYTRYAAKTGITHAQCWAHYPERSFIWDRYVRSLTTGGGCPARTPHDSDAFNAARHLIFRGRRISLPWLPSPAGHRRRRASQPRGPSCTCGAAIEASARPARRNICNGSAGSAATA
jgi:transposase